MDEDPETFQHPQSGDAGKPQDYSQQAPGFSTMREVPQRLASPSEETPKKKKKKIK